MGGDALAVAQQPAELVFSFFVVEAEERLHNTSIDYCLSPAYGCSRQYHNKALVWSSPVPFNEL
jgi:hypothetical protein